MEINKNKKIQRMGEISVDEQYESGDSITIPYYNLSDTILILNVKENKKNYIDLLLLGDEQESMIDRYLEQGELFVLFSVDDSNPIGVAVVTTENETLCELKNIAIATDFQRKGIGMKFVDFLCNYYKHRFQKMQVGTGDSKQTTLFYQSCGFSYSHILKNFFTDNYDHLIIEEGKILKDMIYFTKQL